MSKSDIIIVGAGHAGAQLAMALRQQKFEGSITLIGRESELPYERPPLSKEYMAGEKEFERLYLRPENYWTDKDITLKLGMEVTKVDPDAQTISFADGSAAMEYGELIWATGGDPRKIACAGADLAGVHYVRDREDADAIMAELDSVSEVAVIGGGYIGLEAAAVLTKLGKKVTLLEALPRVLARVAGEDLSHFYEAEHRAQGVDLRIQASVEAILGENGRVSGVQLAGGESISAQMVIVGIGIIPATQPLSDAGAKGENGVEVDSHCRSSLPHIWAIGDCAAHANGFAGGDIIRLESVQNANDQANLVAKAICGDAQDYAATPWFWSNQYDLKLQTVGLSSGYDQAVMRGDPAARKFTIVYYKAGKIVALDCVNNVRDYAQGRKLVEAGAAIEPAKIADAEKPLKELLAEAG